MNRICIFAGLAIAGATQLCVAQVASELPAHRFEDPSRRAKLEQALPAIEALMAQRAAELKLPALAYGVVIDGVLVASKSFGFRDVDAKTLADDRTVFRIASMTKSFTALAVLKLRDAGKLSLDDPIAKHVPELRTLAPPTRDSAPITIRHLLTHTAGFPQDDPFGDRQMGLSNAAVGQMLQQGVPYSNAPGIEFEYSNLGFAILGRIVARVSGVPYERYVDREILAPLGMTETAWTTKAVSPERLAIGYRLDGERHVAVDLADGGDGGFPAMGALITSSRDLSRWIAFMLSAFPPRDDAEHPVALRSSLREMQAGTGFPALFTTRPMPGAPMAAFATAPGYGLFAYRECRLQHGVFHAGGLPGFGSHMRWFPRHGVGVFAMANLTYAPMPRLTGEIVNLLWETGALKPREPSASPALLRAAAEAATIVDAWDDGRATALAASNLFLDTPMDARRDAIRKLREGLGTCNAEPIKAENALRGTFRVRCEKGWLHVNLTLTPTQPPRVQHLAVTGGKPLSDALNQTVDSVVAAMSRGGHTLPLAASADAEAIGATLDGIHSRYGACRIAEILEGDGVTQARVRMSCDRGEVILAVRAQGRQIASIAVTRAPGTTCIP